MKKLILTLILLLIPNLYSCAFGIESDKTINLHSENAYILELPQRATNIQITNPRILEAEINTDIFTNDAQIILKTSDEGISYLSYKTDNKTITVKVLIDNNADVDDSVIEIDQVKEP